MPGAKYASIGNPKQYERLKELGYSKSSAAAISNASVNKRKAKRSSRKSKRA